jgi:hypothetical protein
MKKILSMVAGCCILLACNDKPAEQAASTETAASAETKPAAPRDVDFADAKYTEIGKAGIAAMSKGDVAGWLANYADNAVYIWSSGDSLVGLPAITKYWTERRNQSDRFHNFFLMISGFLSRLINLKEVRIFLVYG